MQLELFYPTPLGEGRLLLLINAFTTQSKCLEGRTKLAKLDFFLRYPAYLERALEIRGQQGFAVPDEEKDNIETRMVRYRFGPWDPSYFSLLGSLIGRGLVEPVRLPKGVGYRTTSHGKAVAVRLAAAPGWEGVARRSSLLKRHMDRSGTWLKDFVYANFPEVVSAEMGAQL